MKNDVTIIGRRGNGKNQLKYVGTYGYFDIFFGYGKYFVFEDYEVSYYSRTYGRCKRWIDQQMERKEEYR